VAALLNENRRVLRAQGRYTLAVLGAQRDGRSARPSRAVITAATPAPRCRRAVAKLRGAASEGGAPSSAQDAAVLDQQQRRSSRAN